VIVTAGETRSESAVDDVAAVLREQFGIDDPALLRAVFGAGAIDSTAI
jgi:hypothetical protein